MGSCRSVPSSQSTSSAKWRRRSMEIPADRSKRSVLPLSLSYSDLWIEDKRTPCLLVVESQCLLVKSRLLCLVNIMNIGGYWWFALVSHPRMYPWLQEKQSTVTFTPGVVEPSFGIDRILFSVLEHSYYVRPKEFEFRQRGCQCSTCLADVSLK